MLPTMGSKELVAWLPTLLGLGAGDIVVIPRVCYPTYEVGAQLAGATVVRADSLTALGPDRGCGLVWVNSPANPTGRVLPAGAPAQGGRLGARARRGAWPATSATCSLGWDGRAGIGATDVCDGSYDGCWRCTRCPNGPTWPATAPGSWPGTRSWSAAAGGAQARRDDRARAGAGGDGRRARRRGARRGAAASGTPPAGERLRAALTGPASRSNTPRRGCTCGRPGARTAGPRWTGSPSAGILVAPGDFYGPAGRRHVRVALTATDERVTAAVARLAG